MLFVSIFAYTISKSVDDPESFVREEIERGEKAEWPCFRTLARLRAAFGELELAVDHSTLIAKARSRAAGKFARSQADVWVSIDDDIDASREDLEALVGAVRAGADVVLAPCVLRDGATLNIAAASRTVRTVQVNAKPVRLLTVVAGGTALSAYSAHAIAHMRACYPELAWRNPDTQDEGLGFFLETIEGGRWYGEDVVFCGRARHCGLRVEATPDTNVMHAGRVASVREWLDGSPPAVPPP